MKKKLNTLIITLMSMALLCSCNNTEIVSYDRQVNDLINNFYPEAVLGLIKDGVNPLDMDISSLNA